MSLLYLSAGSTKWGTGHLLRSLELINAFRKNGLNMVAAALVPDGNELQKLSSITSDYDMCIQTLNELEPVNADGIIVDVHTDLQPDLLLWLQRQGKTVLALDWYHKTDGIVLDKANLRGGAEQLKYAIIRSKFHTALLKKRETGSKYDAVVAIGGADNRGHLDRIYRLFSENKRFEKKNIAVIPGLMSDGRFAKTNSSSAKVSVIKKPDNLSEIMADTSVGITNGGTTLMEFTMLGIPTIVFPQSEQEDNFVRTFLERGSAIMGSSIPEEFTRQITAMWDDEIMLKTMSRKARELIDGLGAKRIIKLALNTFFKGEYPKQ